MNRQNDVESCKVLVNATYFGQCLAEVVNEYYIQKCQYDLCSATTSADKMAALCLWKFTLASECHERGVLLPEEFMDTVSMCTGQLYVKVVLSFEAHFSVDTNCI